MIKIVTLITLVPSLQCMGYVMEDIGPPADRPPTEEPIVVPEWPGQAYMESQYAGIVLAGRYARGSKEWDDKNQEWLDSENEEPYPDDLKEVDGHGYEDSCDAAKGRC